MDSFDSLLAIPLLLSDSETSSPMSSTTSENEEGETDMEDNVNNEDDPIDVGSEEDIDEAVIYSDDVVITSTDSSSRYSTATDTAASATPPTSSQLPIALQRPMAPLPPPPASSSTLKTSRFVPASSATAAATAAAAAAAKNPPTPVIVTATPLPSLGPLRPAQTEYEPAASAAATRLSAQYTDSLRRRAETLVQKRLRTQVRALHTCPVHSLLIDLDINWRALAEARLLLLATCVLCSVHIHEHSTGGSTDHGMPYLA